jgi:hypothetical protein
LYIHEHPTEEKNAYLILRLDFTGIETSMGKEKLFNSFTEKTKVSAINFIEKYSEYLTKGKSYDIQNENDPAQIIIKVCFLLMQNNKKSFLLIDEYDNFANDLIGANEDDLYYEILNKTGFVRTFYEAVKSGAQEGAISRIFMTGVSPIMLDNLTSGFNIAKNITLEKEFNSFLGFTQNEVEDMMNYYWNFIKDIPENTEEKKLQALKDMKTFYNGYLFNEEFKERVYNPDMVLHFMDSFQNGVYPRNMIDMNVRSDYGKIQRIIREDKNGKEQTRLEDILESEEINTTIVQMFPLEAINGTDELVSLMYYMGMLTIDEPFLAGVKLKIPNLVIKNIYWEYMYKKINRELGHIMQIGHITKGLYKITQTGDINDFVSYAYDKVLKYMSNRDLIKMDEKHLKMIFLSFLSVSPVYIPYSELEMNGGYSDIVLYPDSRYGVKNAHIWELKFLKKGENRDEKIKEAKEQIRKYENDEKFIRLAEGLEIYKYIIIGTKDTVEIINMN